MQNKFNRIPIQGYIFAKDRKSLQILDYLLEKGSNLHTSEKGSLFPDGHHGKYIMIRSWEINSQRVDHPKFDDLKDEDSFEFLQKR